MPKPQKYYVLDTNVILHDSDCIYQFSRHNIVLPMTVLEELDQFKKGNDTVNFHAREFVRTIDQMSGEKIFEDGVKIGANHGRLIIKLEREFHDDLKLNFSPSKPDHHTLNIAYLLAKEHSFMQIVLVTKDVNLRMKAKAIGLRAEDFTKHYVQDIEALYRGHRIEENITSDLLTRMYTVKEGIDVREFSFKDNIAPNEYIIMKSNNKSALGYFNPQDGVIERVDKLSIYGITPRNAEQTFALHALLNNDIQLVSISGKAGTGKTLLALAAALERKKNYRQIYLARPIVPLSNKDIGFLPGDIDSKIGPYMQPLFDNLGVIQHQFSEASMQQKKIKELLDDEKLVISPLAYIRGRSLVKIYFIVDEAQNLTPHEIKTIITRAGEGTKVIFTGDIYQIDHPYLDSHSNGLTYLIERMKGQKIYAHINLEKGERSHLAELASNLL